MVKLYTDRLIIRDYDIDDLEDHHELISDYNTMKYLQELIEKNH